MSHSEVAPDGTQQPTMVSTSTSANPPTAPVAPAAGQYTQEQFLAAVEQARQEERARLSAPQQELAEKLAALEAEAAEQRRAREEQERKAAEARAQQEAAARARDEEELSAKDLLAKREAEWNQRFQALQDDAARREALFAQEQKRLSLAAYIQRRVNEETDNIAPEFLGYIDGATEEEVEASITTAKANTASILEGIKQAQLAQRQAIPGVSPTAGNVGPLDQQDSTRTLTPEEIAAIPVNSPDFQRLRQQYGLAGAGRGKGMFQ